MSDDASTTPSLTVGLLPYWLTAYCSRYQALPYGRATARTPGAGYRDPANLTEAVSLIYRIGS
jgi:hypothetical protein